MQLTASIKRFGGKRRLLGRLQRMQPSYDCDHDKVYLTILVFGHYMNDIFQTIKPNSAETSAGQQELCHFGHSASKELSQHVIKVLDSDLCLCCLRGCVRIVVLIHS